MVCSSLSKSFWKHWDSKYDHVLTKKRQGTVSMNRALNCTREMACSHLDDLGDKFIKVGIFSNAQIEESGVWTGEMNTSRYLFLCLF